MPLNWADICLANVLHPGIAIDHVICGTPRRLFRLVMKLNGLWSVVAASQPAWVAKVSDRLNSFVSFLKLESLCLPQYSTLLCSSSSSSSTALDLSPLPRTSLFAPPRSPTQQTTRRHNVPANLDAVVVARQADRTGRDLPRQGASLGRARQA